MVDLNRLEAEVNDWTEAMGIKNFQGPDESLQFKNAFAHAYASANIAYDNNLYISNFYGNAREAQDFLAGTYKALAGTPNWSLTGVFRDGHRDMFNNHIGNQIAEYARQHGLPKEALGYLVTDAIESGQLVADEFNDERVGLMSYDKPIYKGPGAATKGRIRKLFGAKLPKNDPAERPDPKTLKGDNTRVQQSVNTTDRIPTNSSLPDTRQSTGFSNQEPQLRGGSFSNIQPTLAHSRDMVPTQNNRHHTVDVTAGPDQNPGFSQYPLHLRHPAPHRSFVDRQLRVGSKQDGRQVGRNESTLRPDEGINPTNLSGLSYPVNGMSRQYGQALSPLKGSRAPAEFAQSAQTTRKTVFPGSDIHRTPPLRPEYLANSRRPVGDDAGSVPATTQAAISSYSGPKKQIFDFVLRKLLNPVSGTK